MLVQSDSLTGSDDQLRILFLCFLISRETLEMQMCVDQMSLSWLRGYIYGVLFTLIVQRYVGYRREDMEGIRANAFVFHTI